MERKDNHTTQNFADRLFKMAKPCISGTVCRKPDACSLEEAVEGPTGDCAGQLLRHWERQCDSPL